MTTNFFIAFGLPSVHKSLNCSDTDITNCNRIDWDRIIRKDCLILEIKSNDF